VIISLGFRSDLVRCCCRDGRLGLIHPPVGMNIFVIKSVIEDVKISTIFYGVLPFIVTDILRLIILIAFPVIALYLPSQMK
jgi:TRAP-type C4-dicarboxylate transport system permease large subunit